MNVYLVIVLVLASNLLLKANNKKVDIIIVNNDTIPIVKINIDHYLTSQGVQLNNLKKEIPVQIDQVYWTEWFIEHDSLFLQSVHFYLPQSKRDSLNMKVFGNTSLVKNRIFSDFLSDTITGKLGSLMRAYGYNSIYEKERVFCIDSGIVVFDTVYINVINDSSRISRVSIEQACRNIVVKLEDRVNWIYLKKIYKNEYSYVLINFLVDEHGKLQDATCLRSNEVLCNDIVSYLYDLPLFEVIKSKGRPWEESYQLSLYFDFRKKKINGNLTLLY